MNEIRDCHYCGEASCEDEESAVDCYGDFGFFDHEVIDSKKEAEECPFFVYCDIFPKF